MNWANSFLKKVPETHFRPNILPPEGRNEARNTKMYRGQKTHSMRVNARHEMNWANSFFQKIPETPYNKTTIKLIPYEET